MYTIENTLNLIGHNRLRSAFCKYSSNPSSTTSFPCFAWERTQRTLRVSLCGKSRVTRCYGNPATQSVQGVRDDAKHRHEVPTTQ